MGFLVDTYALMEYFVWNNENYRKYFERFQMIKDSYVTEITLVELYYHVYHNEDPETADMIYSSVTHYLNVTGMDEEIIKSAGIFRSEMLKKKKALSYADCINYSTARKLNLKLLTGDNDFEGLRNIEFVQ